MLKWIAAFLMLLDHIGYFFYGKIPDSIFLVLRILGRLSFPLFAYSVALGYKRTRNTARYLLRMLLFAFLTQALFFAAGLITGIGTFWNVLFTFSLALLFLSVQDYISRRLTKPDTKSDCPVTNPPETEKSGAQSSSYMKKVLAIFFFFLISVAAILLNADYGLFGVYSVLLFYYTLPSDENRASSPTSIVRDTALVLFLYLLLNIIWCVVQIYYYKTSISWALLEILSVFAVLLFPINMHKGRPGKMEKYFFYLFYPIHFVALMFISQIF